MSEKTLGIIGGMGPEATVDFMNRIIKLTPAKDDEDHIRMIVDNNPKIPSRIKAILKDSGIDPAPVLATMARNLEQWGADLIAMPCNTSHFYYDIIQKAVNIPVINMLSLVVNRIHQQHPSLDKIGFLGSTVVIQTELYRQKAAAYHVEMIYPDSDVQAGVMESIMKIKTSRYDDKDLLPVQMAARHLSEKGADVIIIGCTELSATSHVIPNHLKCYDASQVLAESIVEMIKNGSVTN